MCIRHDVKRHKAYRQAGATKEMISVSIESLYPRLVPYMSMRAAKQPPCIVFPGLHMSRSKSVRLG